MQKAVLVVLDGFGIGEQGPYNAIQNAKMPFYRSLLKSASVTQLISHGAAVGLPDGVMGNSEVGHMTMGAGRVLYQDLTRISQSIQNKAFFQNGVLKTAFDQPGRLHLIGLCSDGGGHSHLDHLIALLDWAFQVKRPVSIHLFFDGRDAPLRSARRYLEKLLLHPSFFSGLTVIASACGRYFSMDRDHRWDRIEKAYLAMTGANFVSCSVLEWIEQCYAKGQTDEFFEPVCFYPKGAIQKKDTVIFFNYRSDRAIQLSLAFAKKEFEGFLRSFLDLHFVTMTRYSDEIPADVAFPKEEVDFCLGFVLKQAQAKQLRIAETEKYAHVTFFFNGGKKEPFLEESRILVPSVRDVLTYDLNPQMSAFQVARFAVEEIQKKEKDFVLVNFANADMVGHTGNYAATVKAVECLDVCLQSVVNAAQQNGYVVMITADHGNAEQMCDDLGEKHTQHTVCPVPFLMVGEEKKALREGTLSDIMPTICEVMGLPIPEQVQGRAL